ncbi:Uncharacterized protein HZ326_8393 [Fusarium oxysporum f. sp. albedinis]|nr:Uncharacterized protein HZ326_8393 [Fusarium oxysporum f. sp. albedinis]
MELILEYDLCHRVFVQSQCSLARDALSFTALIALECLSWEITWMPVHLTHYTSSYPCRSLVNDTFPTLAYAVGTHKVGSHIQKLNSSIFHKVSRALKRVPSHILWRR